VKDNLGPEHQDSERATGLSAPVLTAIVGGVVAVITATLQFVVAPLMIKNNSASVGRVNAAPTMAISSQSMIPTAPGAGTNGASAPGNEVKPDPAALGLGRSLPIDSSVVGQIDRDLLSSIATRPLHIDDVRQLNCWQLRVLRNILPALHGHKFNDPALDRLFRAQSWYRIGPESPLSAVEDQNMRIVRGAETESSCLVGGA
jgi:hypothetical protein